jgi:HD-like signal output (HDOD) protein
VKEPQVKVAENYCRQNIRNYDEVIGRVAECPVIGSLKKINDSLMAITASNDGTVNEIAEVISRDMSLTSRLLRQVNSVFTGLSVRVTSLEEAIFYLGLRQIRRLAITTRVIDEMESFGGKSEAIDWPSFWAHSIGCGIIAREIMIMAKGSSDDDIYYICGLLHDIGKLVMYNVYPDELLQTCNMEFESKIDLVRYQQETFGWDYTHVGGLYLERNNMPQVMVESVLFQTNPGQSVKFKRLCAGIELAEIISRFSGCCGPFEKFVTVEENSWESVEGWGILFGSKEREQHFARASIANCIEQFPILLKGLI